MSTTTATSKLNADDIAPGEAIMAGFSMVAADNESLGPTLRAAARKAADEFKATIESFPPGTRERHYVEELLLAAVSFAAGLARRQQERSQRIVTAEQEREFNFKRIVQTQRATGILKGGVQLLLLGGFAYALVNAVFGYRLMEEQDDKRRFVSLATALASALIGSFFKAWYTGTRIDQVDHKYRDALKEAKQIYMQDATQEYEFAAQEANLAWKKFTGRPPPMTDAFRVLVLGLLGSDAPEESGPAR